jgi:chloramphenicol 3-O-phosphotransferase
MVTPLVGIVGPCSSGKSTLRDALRAKGYQSKEILQEHSLAPTMWKRITNPDILIYLDVTMEEAARREGLEKPPAWWEEERRVRLAHARQYCDLYVDTSALSPQKVLAHVTAFLETNVGNA